MSVLLETSYGDIVVDLLPERAPVACLNFVKLCAVKYYNDCEFFRVEKGFIAQTGDPSNTGHGGVSVFARCSPLGLPFFKSERSPAATHARKGTVSMAASASAAVDGVKGHASQFFITLADGLNYLDAEHTVFGLVAEGMDVVDRIGNAVVDENFRPYRLIRIRHTIILHDPFDDPKGLPKDCPSPEPAQGGRDDRLGSDEEEDDWAEGDDQERRLRLKQMEEEREARSRAEVLEIIGDIGDADLKPPENVLFICKLNPVTEAEDLEIIFSRFGECKADILRDKSTGDSLCYGFIEFADKRQCENAYFKMESALIDDRRVRVDFSQSVSKLWNAARRAKASNTKMGQQSGWGVAKRPRLDNGDTPMVEDKSRDKHPYEEADRGRQRSSKSLEVERKIDAVRPPRRQSRFDIRPR